VTGRARRSPVRLAAHGAWGGGAARVHIELHLDVVGIRGCRVAETPRYGGALPGREGGGAGLGGYRLELAWGRRSEVDLQGDVPTRRNRTSAPVVHGGGPAHAAIGVAGDAHRANRELAHPTPGWRRRARGSGSGKSSRSGRMDAEQGSKQGDSKG
jgi:hypothetical protein